MAKYLAAGGPLQGASFADELFSRHYSRVALWCFRIAGDRDAAADLAQEVFSKAWQNLDHFRAESKFTTWLYTITRNHCFNSLEKKARTPEEGVEPAELDALGSTLAEFDTALEQTQLLDVARELMASELTEVEAQVMTLHYSDELPLDTISRLLKMENSSGAKAYIVSAKRKLKSAVARWVAGNARTPGGKERSGHEGNQ